MYEFEVSEKLQKILRKIFKKDRRRYEAILKKIDEIVNQEDAHHYKNLSKDMKEYKRVHVDSHFVLTFRVIDDENLIRFIDLQHHDHIYKRK